MSQLIGEPPIAEQYFCQVVPARYTTNSNQVEYNYTPSQRIFANTVSLLDFSINNQFTNINQFYNSFQVFVNNRIYVVQIPPQNYSFWDIFDLQTIIQTQLNLQVPVGTWTVILGGNNNKFSVVSNSAFPFNFVYSENYQFGQVLRYLGFSSSQDPSFQTQSLSHQSKYAYQVQVTQQIQVQLKNTAFIKSDTTGVVASINLNAAIQSQLYWVQPYYLYSRKILSKKNPIPIYNFQIQLLDDNNNPLDLSGVQVSLTIMFESYEQKY